MSAYPNEQYPYDYRKVGDMAFTPEDFAPSRFNADNMHKRSAPLRAPSVSATTGAGELLQGLADPACSAVWRPEYHPQCHSWRELMCMCVTMKAIQR